jgi:hypothetical protein
VNTGKVLGDRVADVREQYAVPIQQQVLALRTWKH